ncbi:MAG TPA: hypothetical protein VJZ04_09150 [Lachnospiraceae bacterium]|nr:hypothetical protein [Lachnospiraceae bacterium]
MNRFEKRKFVTIYLHKIKLSIITFVALLTLFLIGISSVTTTTKEKQLESLETAIHRSVVHCYAVEGTYPPNLTYIEEHYGLIYDKNLFFVDYQSIGSNILPDVTIIVKN